MEIYDGRSLLIYLAVKYEGDYDKICNAIVLREDPGYEEVMKVNKSLTCKTITLLDYDYPLKLKQVMRPPFVLFYYGDITLLDRPMLAVVGSRLTTAYGRFCTDKVLSEMIQGRVLISGLARGIDSIAHECALKYGAKTIAVLGTAINKCYPPENKELYEIIKKDHLLISEYPPNAEPNPSHFPMRNRIVISLADGVYIPQINNYMSGTMISVTIAANTGKQVFVAPDRIDSNTINNQLIDEGATFTIDGETILTMMKWK